MVELTVVIPTFNERPNIAPSVARLDATLRGVDWEVVFVDDDSPDGTAEECRRLAATDARVRILHRIGRRGLASACIEGMLASASPFVAVMDGDMQHDESILRRMLEIARDGADVVVGSRHVEGGGMGEFAHDRIRLSEMGGRLSRVILKQELSDPMSGFFLISRGYLQEVVHRLSGIGFKILLDLVASSERPLRIVEIPYVFRNRLYGESKLDISVAMEYLVLLVDKLVGYTVPTGFALFSLVGGAGLVIQLAVLGALYRSGILSFTRAQIIGVFLAMISNFLLNNAITHRSNRLHTISSLMRGFAAFVMACSLGALANVATSRYLLDRRIHWIVAALVGIVVGSVWNYSVTAVLTWHVGQRRARQAARAPTLGGRA